MSDSLSLYIHIPFCVRKCLYCDFLSSSASDDTVRTYFHALKSEIFSYRHISGKYGVTSVYFGGGTPSLPDSAYVGEIMAAIREVFAPEADAEISLEMNPGTADRKKIHDYRISGVNRISVGLQSAVNTELAALGRIHTYEDFMATFNMLREAGFDNINVDLMTGIPGQDMNSARYSFEKVTELFPEHISAYSLIIEPGTPFGDMDKDKLALPDEDTDMAIYKFTAEFLRSKGYERYEISNYSRPGKECRHNIVYWDRGNYIGLGAGAASLLEGRRFTNTGDMKEYVSSPGKARTEDRMLAEKECMEEFMFLGLRKICGIKRCDFERFFGIEIEKVYGEAIKKQIRNGLMIRNGDFYSLSDRGTDVSNEVLSEFLL